MSSLTSYCTDYVCESWIKYRNLVTSRVSSSASVVVRESEYYCAVQYISAIQCTVQKCTVEYILYFGRASQT